MTMQGINLKTLDIPTASGLNEKNDLSSEDGLLREYKRLSVQLKQLQIIEKRSQDQIETLKKDQMSMMDEIDKFSNLDVSVEFAAQSYEHFVIVFHHHCC